MSAEGQNDWNKQFVSTGPIKLCRDWGQYVYQLLYRLFVIIRFG